MIRKQPRQKDRERNFHASFHLKERKKKGIRKVLLTPQSAARSPKPFEKEKKEEK